MSHLQYSIISNLKDNNCGYRVIPEIDKSKLYKAPVIGDNILNCLENNVPSSVPGICFLSGGQSDIEATEHLSIMNSIKKTNQKLSFSYGRALQQSALIAWNGKEENITRAQNAFIHRAHMNGLASIGQWSIELDQ